MDIAGIKASTDEVLAQIPGLEGFLEGARQSLTQSVREVVTEAVAALADGVGQIAQIGYSINGAEIVLSPSGPLSVTVTATIPTFTAKISMPLVPKA